MVTFRVFREIVATPTMIHYLLLLFALAPFAAQPVLAQDLSAERQQLLLDLSRVFLSSDGPKQEEEHKWKGVVLAPPGQPLSPTIASFDVVAEDRTNVAQALADSGLFDRALVVADGVGSPGSIYLADTWQSILADSMPKKPYPRDGLTLESRKWLFKIPDRVDKARGIDFVGEPSAFFLRYREYELLYGLLVNAKRRESSLLDSEDSWRLHPRLSKFKHLEDAMRSVEEDWIRFGYRREITEARTELDRLVGAKEWIEWTKAKATFENEKVLVGKTGQVYRTLLSPPPPEWLRMGSWLALSTQTKNKQGIRFQVARIRIERPWLQIDALMEGRITIGDAKYRDFFGSGGKATLMEYPRARMNVYPEELVLVKNIQYGPEAAVSLHPLTIFANPEQTQLLGYVVRFVSKRP